MICALSFPLGKPLEKGTDLEKLIDLLVKEDVRRIYVFPPGAYNLTPLNMPNANWNYALEVRADGSGTLEMVARTRDVVTFDVHMNTMSGPKPGDRTVRLPDDQETVVIVAQKTVGVAHLFHIVFHLDLIVTGGIAQKPVAPRL